MSQNVNMKREKFNVFDVDICNVAYFSLPTVNDRSLELFK